MDYIILLNSISYIAIAFISSCFLFVLGQKNRPENKIRTSAGVIGFFYTILGIVNLCWALDILNPSQEDFILMHFMITIITSIIMLYMIYKITANRNLIYLLLLYIAAIFAINFSLNYFFLFTVSLSYLLMVIVFLELVIISKLYLKKAGIAGLAYSVLSMIIILDIYKGNNSYDLVWFIPNIGLIFVLYYIMKDIRYLGILKEYTRNKINNKILLIEKISRFILFIITITGFIFLSTIALHEMGHAIAAQYYGCEHTKAVIYDVINAPHTEIFCGSDYNETIITLAGFFATITTGLLFFLAGGRFTSILSYIILGLSLIISNSDLSELGLSSNIIAAISIAGLIIMVIATIKLSIYYIKQEGFILNKRNINKKNKYK